MKTRNGFISNSSSSSFVIPTKEECDKYKVLFEGYKTYYVKDLLFKLELVERAKKNVINYFDENKDGSSYWIEDLYSLYETNYSELKELIKEFGDEVSITDPMDRNVEEYDLRSRFGYKVFESDL